VYLDAQKSAFFYNIAKNKPGVFSTQTPIAMLPFLDEALEMLRL
jgi:hypothetical protein